MLRKFLNFENVKLNLFSIYRKYKYYQFNVYSSLSRIQTWTTLQVCEEVSVICSCGLLLIILKISVPSVSYELWLILLPAFIDNTKVFFLRIQELGDLPLPITNLVGKTYLFKVTIEKDNYLYKHHTYKVEKIMTNEEVISEFDPNYVSTVKI